MDEFIAYVGPNRVVLGKRKWAGGQSSAEMDRSHGIEDTYANDIESLYADDDPTMESVSLHAGGGGVIICAHGTQDEHEDFGEAVFADEESEGEDSVVLSETLSLEERSWTITEGWVAMTM